VPAEEWAGIARRLSRVGRDPVIEALFLSLLSTPFAAVAIRDSARSFHGFPPNPPVTLEVAVRLAVVAVLVAGLAGGSVGKLLARGHPVLGVAAAAATAWASAIITLPIAASVLGISYRVSWYCISTCLDMNSDAPSSGLDAYIQSVMLTTIGPAWVALVLVFLAVVMSRSRQRIPALGLALLGVAGFNFWSMLEAPAAAIALVVGIVVWAYPFISTHREDPMKVGGSD